MYYRKCVYTDDDLFKLSKNVAPIKHTVVSTALSNH